jgi:ABC-2 type transport system ATP-binding protein
MLLGLVRPSAGTLVLGARPARPSLARIRSLIESPSFYPFLSGRDNLRVLARYARVRQERIEEVLEEVGLSPRGRDRFRTYSLGMKQRLGIAAALLIDPDLVILDEPTNGWTRQAWPRCAGSSARSGAARAPFSSPVT